MVFKRLSTLLLFVFSAIVAAAPSTIVTTSNDYTLDRVAIVTSPNSAGTYLAFSSYTAEVSRRQAFLQNISAGTSALISVNGSGDPAEQDIYDLHMANLGVVYFSSNADNLTDHEISYYSQLFHYDVASDTLGVVTNSDGELFNRDIRILKTVPSTNDIFFKTEASNALAGLSSYAERVFRFNWSDKSITLVEGDTNSIRSIYDISSNGQSLLISANSNVLSYGNCSRYAHGRLYIQDVATNELTFISTSQQADRCGSVHVAYFAPDGKVAFDSSWGDGIYDPDTEATTFFDFGLFNYARLMSFSPDSETLLIEASILSEDRRYWLYDLDTHGLSMVSVLDDLTAGESYWIDGKQNFSSDGNDIYLPLRHENSSVLGYKITPADFNFTTPSSVSAVTVSTDKLAEIQLGWSDVGAFRYLVYRKIAGSSDEPEFLAVTENVTYIDKLSGLDAALTYDYVIEACNLAFSCSTATLAGGQLTAPAKVGNVIEDIQGDIERRMLSWPPVDLDDVYYEVHRRYNFSDSTFTAYTNQYNLSLPGDSPSLIKVRACYLNVCGDFSDEIEILPSPLNNVSNLRFFVNDTFDQVEVHWEPAEFASYYKVYYRDDTENNYVFRQKVYGTSYLDKLAVNGESIRYRVEACDQFDNCTYGIDGSLGYLDQRLFDDANKPDLSVNAEGSYTVITSGRYYRRYESYSLYRRETRFGSPTLIDQQSQGINTRYSFTDNTVEAGKTYFYYIVGCINAMCRTSYDIEFEGIRSIGSSVGAISNFTASQGTYQGHIALNWTVSGDIDKILIYRDDLLKATLGGGDTEYLDFSISEGKKYQYHVIPVLSSSVYNEDYHGTPSPTLIGSTKHRTGAIWQPPKIELSTIKGASFSEIEINWLNVSNIYNYEIYSTSNLSDPFTLQTTTSGAGNAGQNKSHREYNLAPGVTVYYQVRACTRVVCGPFSDTIEGATSNVSEAPSGNATFNSLTANADGTVDIEINALAGATYYQVLRKTDVFSTSQNTYKSKTTEYQDTSVSANSTYHYRVQACNPAGCTAPSAYSEVTTPVFVSNSSNSLYYITSVDTEDTNFTINYQRRRYGNSVSSLKFYSSTTHGGTKTLLQTLTSVSYSGQVTIDTLDSDTLYYFWIENCYDNGSGETCEFLREFYLAKNDTSLNEVIPAPEQPVVTASKSDYQYIHINDDAWKPFGVEIEVHRSNSLEGEKYFLGRIGSSNFSLYSEPYKDTTYYIWARTCYEGECSEFSTPASWSIAGQHDTNIGASRDWSGSKFENYTKLRPNRLDSRKRLYVKDGFTGSFDLYLRSGLSYTNGCNHKRFDLRLPVSGITDGSFSLLQIYPGNVTSCQDERFNGYDDANKFYLVIGNDYNNPIPFDSDVLLDKIKSVRLTVNSDFTGRVQIGNAVDVEVSWPVLAALAPEFARLEFSQSISSSSDYIASPLFRSASDFDANRPNFPSFGAYESGGGIRAYWSKDDSANTVEVRYNRFNNGVLTGVSPSEYETSTSVYFIYFGTSNFIVSARECNAEGVCSSEKYDYVELTSSSSAPPRPTGLSAEIEPNSRGILLSWSPVESDDSHLDYEVYGGSSRYNLKDIGHSNGTQMLIQELPSSEYYVAVKACSGDNCSSLSNTLNISEFVDQDKDGLTDREELALGTNPRIADTDEDSLSDLEEYNLGINPLRPDTDGDGILDGVEVSNGTDPLHNQACPGYLCGSSLRGWRMATLKTE